MDHDAWDSRYAQADLVWSAEPNRWFAQEAAALAPGRALDLGAGEGRNAIWLAERGWETTAVDFSAVAIGKGRELARSRGVALTWVVDDLLRYRPAPGTFDLVGVVYIHLVADERRRVLQSAMAALAPGGRAIVIGHHADNLTEGVGGPQDPRLLFTAPEIVADLPGLHILRAARLLRDVETDCGRRTAVDALVVGVAPGRSAIGASPDATSPDVTVR